MFIGPPTLMRSPDAPMPQAIAPTSSPPTISSSVTSPANNSTAPNSTNNTTTTTTTPAATGSSNAPPHDWANTDLMESMFNAAAEANNNIEDGEDGDGGTEENLHVC